MPPLESTTTAYLAAGQLMGEALFHQPWKKTETVDTETVDIFTQTVDIIKKNLCFLCNVALSATFLRPPKHSPHDLALNKHANPYNNTVQAAEAQISTTLTTQEMDSAREIAFFLLFPIQYFLQPPALPALYCLPRCRCAAPPAPVDRC